MSEPPSKVYFDNRAHRANANYARSALVRRVLWDFAKPLFRLSPRRFYGLRNGLLRLFGAKIGREVRIYPSVDIFHPWLLEVGDVATIGPRVQVYNLGLVRIGPECLISQNVNLCAGTHDYRQPNLPLLTPPIIFGRGVWVCADVFVGPNVSVGDYAILGARSVVLRDVDPLAIVGGNPAMVIKYRT